jgi:hypothetical protein
MSDLVKLPVYGGRFKPKNHKRKTCKEHSTGSACAKCHGHCINCGDIIYKDESARKLACGWVHIRKCYTALEME